MNLNDTIYRRVFHQVSFEMVIKSNDEKFELEWTK